MFVHYMNAVSLEARSGHYNPRNWRSRWFWATTWLMGTKHGCFARAASALNQWAFSPASIFLIRQCNHVRNIFRYIWEIMKHIRTNDLSLIALWSRRVCVDNCSSSREFVYFLLVFHLEDELIMDLTVTIYPKQFLNLLPKTRECYFFWHIELWHCLKWYLLITVMMINSGVQTRGFSCSRRLGNFPIKSYMRIWNTIEILVYWYKPNHIENK